MAGDAAPGYGATAADPVVVDIDATIVIAHRTGMGTRA
jgi:hypothetical protein